MRHQWAVGAVAAVLAWTVCGGARPAARQQPAPRVIREGILDLITLQVPSLPEAAGTPVAIRRFSVEAVDLGTGAEGGKATRVAEATKVREDGPKLLLDELVARLTKSMAFREVIAIGPDAAAPAGAILVEGRFVKIDPGSRAKRYLAGFGAGKSTVAVEGAVKDAKGETLATFQQKRHGSMGAFGGDSLGKLTSDSRSIGGDIAEFLAAWARGKSLK